MRIKMVMKDIEYRNALILQLMRTQSNWLLETGTDFQSNSSTLLVTDVGEGKLREGMVFLGRDSSKCHIDGKGPYTLYRYSPVTDLSKHLILCHFLWTGEGTSSTLNHTSIVVGSMGGATLGERYAEILARQIVYQKKCRVLIVPMTTICTDSSYVGGKKQDIRRLLYYLSNGKSAPLDVFFERDRYDIYRIRMPPGLNELAFLTTDMRRKILEMLQSYVDVTVYTIGDQLTTENMELIRDCTHRYMMIQGGEQNILSRVFEEENIGTVRFRTIDTISAAQAMDDFEDIFGENNEETSNILSSNYRTVGQTDS